MRHTLLSGAAGVLFGVGLLVAGMTRPSKVVGFLDVTGDWDPSLAFVMMGAIAVHFLAYRLIPRMPSPWLGGRFALPTRNDIDARLVAGAALFGLGWGLGGYCPGPAIVSVVTGTADALLFFGSMLAGMALFGFVARAFSSRDTA
jgi:uncharacterized membrane protein YedE/YeeE